MKNLLYVSYNLTKNGPFDEAVAISNELGCVTWFHPSRLNPKQLPCPTGIIIQIAGVERYYRGHLLAVQRAEKLGGSAFATGERNHRPQAWRAKDARGVRYKSVLFINGLKEVERPTNYRESPSSPERYLHSSRFATLEPPTRRGRPSSYRASLRAETAAQTRTSQTNDATAILSTAATATTPIADRGENHFSDIDAHDRGFRDRVALER